ncbi:hypothetical protein ADIMK_1676 [Marinobacterium lacunae]|uniref:Uncharacterized protein n=1 Tax=Marinobacterium lacunae TaxID=1232683 RepID=A0A081G0X5_9GAMM|nr:hypothetical protein ADIMK_1676 [Marinobacterium lacunae]
MVDVCDDGYISEVFDHAVVPGLILKGSIIRKGVLTIDY